MCEIYYRECAAEGILGISVEGHAEDRPKGSSPVCAALTTLMRALVCALEADPLSSGRKCLELESGFGLAMVNAGRRAYERLLPLFRMVKEELVRITEDHGLRMIIED